MSSLVKTIGGFCSAVAVGDLTLIIYVFKRRSIPAYKDTFVILMGLNGAIAIIAFLVACVCLFLPRWFRLFSYIGGCCKKSRQRTNRSLNTYHDHSRRTFSFTPGIAPSSATAINAETAELTLLNPVDSNINNSITSLDITDTDRTRSRAIEQDVCDEEIVPSPVEDNLAPPLDSELDPPPPSYTEALLLNPGQIEVNVIGSDTNLTPPPEYATLQDERY